MKPLFFCFLAGLAGATGFAPLKLWPVTLLALAYLLWLIRDAPRVRSALARGWWFGVGHFTLGLNWIATAFTFQSEMPAWLGWLAVVLLSLFLAIYPAAAAGLAWRYGRDRTLRLVLLFAAAWIVTEWLRSTLFTGFAWNPLGVSLLPLPVAQLAPWFGTYGLSGVAALLGGAILLLSDRRWIPAAALVGSLAAATLIAFLVRPAAPEPKSLAVRIVQPNIGQQDKWQEGFLDENMERLRRLSARSGGGPRLLLWPEAAVTRPLENGLSYAPEQEEVASLRREVASMLAPGDLLLTGGVTWQSADGLEVTSATNSVFAMDATGRILGRYDKAHLVPYGEYLPIRPVLSAMGLSRLAPGDIDFDAGPGAQTLTLPVAGNVGFQLCYEIIFPGDVANDRIRPDFIFNPSNDAWFGAWGPPQHLAQARLRALEEGLPILRSTPTGISAVIDADGRVVSSLPWRTAGVIDAQLPSPRPPTLFALAGNLLPFLFALLLVGLAIAFPGRARGIAEGGEAR